MRLQSFLDWGDRLDARVMGASWRDVQSEDGEVLAVWRQIHPLAESTGLLGKADRLDRRVLRGRPSTVIPVPVGQVMRAAVVAWRGVLVIVICVALGITIPAPFGGIAATGVGAFHINRVWWKLHNQKRERMRAEIAAHHAALAIDTLTTDPPSRTDAAR